MNFLSSGTGYALFEREARKKTYVDKSMLIDRVYRYAMEINAYICITRPRRFGKSVAANMLAAFFDESTAEESRILFGKMEIGRLWKPRETAGEAGGTIAGKTGAAPDLYWLHQGKCRVIRVNMIKNPTANLVPTNVVRG